MKMMKGKKYKKLYTILFIVYVCITFVNFFISFKQYKVIHENKKLITIYSYVKDYYYDKSMNVEDLEKTMLSGMLDALPDDYSMYIDKDDTLEYKNKIQGINSGIGITIFKNEIVNVAKNSPAEKAGLKVNDKIIKFNNIVMSNDYTKDIESINNSKNNNDFNFLLINRDGKEIEFKIKDEVYKSDIVEYEILDDNIGFIKLNSFSSKMYPQFDKALKLFKERKIKGLIIDLRYNLGGEKEALEYVSDALMKDTVIGTIEYRDSSLDEVIKTDSNAFEVPMVVLTNELTASCSEILTGSIVVNNKGISIGTTTFGKSTVLSSVEFDDKSSFNLSVANMILSDGYSIEGKGISPTIEEKDESKHINLAIEYINKNFK